MPSQVLIDSHSTARRQIWWGLHTALVTVCLSSVFVLSVQAQNPEPDIVTETEIQTLLDQRPAQPVATATTTLPLGANVPSLWWTDQQYGGKLVTDWAIYVDDRRNFRLVQLEVRAGIWSRYSQSERYAVINNFSTEVRDLGYQVIILDRRQNRMAAYLCDFVPETLSQSTAPSPQAVTDLPSCRAWLSPRYPPDSF